MQLAVEEGNPARASCSSDAREESNLDWIDTQLTMIDDIGVELYTQAQIRE